LSPDFRRPSLSRRGYTASKPVARSFCVNLQNPFRIRANDAFPQQSLAFRAPQLVDILAKGQLNHRKFAF
jgi:hypothetical protein